MSEYDQYVAAVNKIFEYITKMKAAIKDQDNQNLIESIEQYKQIIINSANLFSKEAAPAPASNNMEELGND